MGDQCSMANIAVMCHLHLSSPLYVFKSFQLQQLELSHRGATQGGEQWNRQRMLDDKW